MYSYELRVLTGEDRDGRTGREADVEYFGCIGGEVIEVNEWRWLISGSYTGWAAGWCTTWSNVVVSVVIPVEIEEESPFCNTFDDSGELEGGELLPVKLAGTVEDLVPVIVGCFCGDADIF